MILNEEQKKAIRLLRDAKLDAKNGLDEELFLMMSALTPIPNVDLLITNSRNQILLARRNDPYYSKSWHIPGGCIRYGENFENRIRQTALKELGCEVTFDPEPLAVRNVLRKENSMLSHPRERGHHIAILFRCYLPKGYELNNNGKTEADNGFLKWFDKLPQDFLDIQHVYDRELTAWRKD